VGEAELEWLYGHATVVLFPSLYEGFGFPLAEAFARGIPAIAADIPTLREIGEGAAEFVPAEDPGAWAATVAALAAEPARRDALRDAGRVRARALDYRTTAANTLALLREAVGWGPARTAEGALDGVPPRR
jgi:alpha-1,3-rhamnosyl/mannosyltransferase